MNRNLEQFCRDLATLVEVGKVAEAREFLEERRLSEREKLDMMEMVTHLIHVHEVLREELVVSADSASAKANRRAMATACGVTRPTIYAMLARRNQVVDRRPPRR